MIDTFVGGNNTYHITEGAMGAKSDVVIDLDAFRNILLKKDGKEYTLDEYIRKVVVEG